MSDRMDDVLAAIDAELHKCICGSPIPPDGPSLNYCSDVCQYRYTAERIGAEPDSCLTYPLPPAETDGRAINDEVNDWARASAENRPGGYGIDAARWVGAEASEIAPTHTPPAAEDQQVIRPVTNWHSAFAITFDATAWDEAMERARALLTITADELRENLLRLGRAVADGEGAEAPPMVSMGEIDYDAEPTPGGFRHRAEDPCPAETAHTALAQDDYTAAAVAVVRTLADDAEIPEGVLVPTFPRVYFDRRAWEEAGRPASVEPSGEVLIGFDGAHPVTSTDTEET